MAVKENSDVPQLVIFAEGGTTNGLQLLKFRRGAFENLSTIQPFYIEYYSPFCNPACDAFPMHLHVMFMACQLFSTVRLRRMPLIQFTEAIKKRAKEGNDVEEYAETVRDIYSKTYGLEKVDYSLMNKDRKSVV